MKSKEAMKMTNIERTEKIKELRMELIKARLNNKKTTNPNPREIKRTIARLFTFNNANKEKVEIKNEKKVDTKKETKKSENKTGVKK